MADRKHSTMILVEDNPIILLDLQQILMEIGVSDVMTASTLGEATQMALKFPTVPVLLDIDLNGESSIGLALEMRRDGRAFAFLTGYGRDTPLPEELVDIEVVQKPVSAIELKRVITRLSCPL